VLARRFPDFDGETLDMLGRVLPHTMTSPQRIAAVIDAARYIEAAGVPGAFVECGVWKGGSSMAAALAFKTPRPLYLFDTYEGMTAPTAADRRPGGRTAADMMKGADILCYSSLDEVRANMASTGYPAEQIVYVKGRVEDTLPASAPNPIAILRLDTDWYESTRHELECLYPRLSPGGVLIIDDYGHWTGAKKAVDEYFAAAPLLLTRIDYTGRMAVKSYGDVSL
jgi:O-methyltransferase